MDPGWLVDSMSVAAGWLGHRTSQVVDDPAVTVAFDEKKAYENVGGCCSRLSV